MNKYIQKGFTLIEILIVITIIGVLVGFLLPNLTGIGGKTSDIARKKLLGEVVSNVEMYYLENGVYPSGTFCIDGQPEGADQAATQDETTLFSYFGNVAPSQEFTADENAYCTVGAGQNVAQNHNRVYYQKLNDATLGNYAVFMRSEDPINHDHAFTIENGITDSQLVGQKFAAAADGATNVMAIIK